MRNKTAKALRRITKNQLRKKETTKDNRDLYHTAYKLNKTTNAIELEYCYRKLSKAMKRFYKVLKQEGKHKTFIKGK